MAFAIFYMVIGELITYHQRVIFGIDFFGNHHPFTKPKTGDDGSTTHYKPHKGGDKQDTEKTFFATILSGEIITEPVFFYFRESESSWNLSFEKVFLHSNRLRGPPKFSC
jgi:hypothetical protein